MECLHVPRSLALWEGCCLRDFHLILPTPHTWAPDTTTEEETSLYFSGPSPVHPIVPRPYYQRSSMEEVKHPFHAHRQEPDTWGKPVTV